MGLPMMKSPDSKRLFLLVSIPFPSSISLTVSNSLSHSSISLSRCLCLQQSCSSSISQAPTRCFSHPTFGLLDCFSEGRSRLLLVCLVATMAASSCSPPSYMKQDKQTISSSFFYFSFLLHSADTFLFLLFFSFLSIQPAIYF